MDPTACLNLICDYLDDNDTISATNSACDLLEWLKRGGFPPNLSAVSSTNAKKLVECFCTAIAAAYPTPPAGR